jgi:dynein heavy chain
MQIAECIHYSLDRKHTAALTCAFLQQGILSIRPAQCGGNVPAALTRLWLHEVQRVFGDRLVCQDDRAWLQELQQDLLKSKFGWKSASAVGSGPTSLAAGPAGSRVVSAAASAASSYAAVEGEVSNALFEGDEAVLFGDFLKMGLARSERCYEQLPSMPKLAQLMERYLEEFNASRGKAGSAAMAEAAAAAGARKGAGVGAAAAAGGGGGGRMDLVFFRDAVMHVVRLARVLRQPRWVWCSYFISCVRDTCGRLMTVDGMHAGTH